MGIFKDALYIFWPPIVGDTFCVIIICNHYFFKKLMNTSEQYEATNLFSVFCFSDRFRLLTLLHIAIVKKKRYCGQDPSLGCQ